MSTAQKLLNLWFGRGNPLRYKAPHAPDGTPKRPRRRTSINAYAYKPFKGYRP